jgi:hypothetical protein
MKYEPDSWMVITFEASWFDEGACGSFRALLMHRLFVRRPPCPTLVGAWGAAGLGAGLFLEADGGKSGWLCVVIFPELSELESPRLDCVSSLELSSVEAYIYIKRVSKHKHVCRSP